MLSTRPPALALVASVRVLAGLTAAPATAQLCNQGLGTNDGDCDEPHGLNLCAWGADMADCANPNANDGRGTGYRPGSGTAGTGPDPKDRRSGLTDGSGPPAPIRNIQSRCVTLVADTRYIARALSRGSNPSSRQVGH